MFKFHVYFDNVIYFYSIPNYLCWSLIRSNENTEKYYLAISVQSSFHNNNDIDKFMFQFSVPNVSILVGSRFLVATCPVSSPSFKVQLPAGTPSKSRDDLAHLTVFFLRSKYSYKIGSQLSSVVRVCVCVKSWGQFMVPRPKRPLSAADRSFCRPCSRHWSPPVCHSRCVFAWKP